MSGLSIHAVDVARGLPAEGLKVAIFALEPERRLIAEGALAASGALDDPINTRRLAAGAYEVVFQIGIYLGRRDGFLDETPFRFRIADPERHTHLPLKFTPWGFSLFRGS